MLFRDAMTRAPVVRFPTARRAVELKNWLDEPENFERIKASFESTTNFGKLQDISSTVAGRCVHMRFKCSTGDAMGMNMVSKGCLQVCMCCICSVLILCYFRCACTGVYCAHWVYELRGRRGLGGVWTAA